MVSRVYMGIVYLSVSFVLTKEHSTRVVPVVRRRARVSLTSTSATLLDSAKAEPSSDAGVASQNSSTTSPPDAPPLPPPSSTLTSEMKASALIGVILGSVAAVLIVLAIVLICRRRQAQARAKIMFRGGPSTASTESDDPTKPRRRADPFSSVYATDFASSEYRDSLSPDHNFDGIVLSDPFRRKDRVKPELDHPVPFFSYYHQASTQRRSSLESQDSSIISYTESDKVRGTTTSSTADETPRQLPHTPMMAYQPNHRDDSMSSSVTASREMWRISGHSASMSSAGFDLLQSPSMGSAGVFSLPEKMTMLDDSASQTSSRESYDI